MSVGLSTDSANRQENRDGPGASSRLDYEVEESDQEVYSYRDISLWNGHEITITCR